MFASIRRYRMDHDSVAELSRRVDRDFANQIEMQAGFISYELIDCGDGEVMTFSLFSESDMAEATRSLARRWTAERGGEMNIQRVGVYHGEVWVNRAGEGSLNAIHSDGISRFASIRRYSLRSGSISQLMHIVDEVFADEVAMLDGFESYQALDCGAAGIMAVSLFDDQFSAEQSDELALEFTRSHLRSFGLERTSIIAGEVMVSRAMARLLVPAHA